MAAKPTMMLTVVYFLISLSNGRKLAENNNNNPAWIQSKMMTVDDKDCIAMTLPPLTFIVNTTTQIKNPDPAVTTTKARVFQATLANSGKSVSVTIQSSDIIINGGGGFTLTFGPLTISQNGSIGIQIPDAFDGGNSMGSNGKNSTN